MNTNRIANIALIGICGLGLGACGGDAPPSGDRQDAMPAGDPAEQMGGMESMGTQGMGNMMRRHAQEADSMVAAMREHVQQMRSLSPEQWHERMGEHVTRVSEMLGLMSRQVAEMDMGMGMSDEQMGEMMGMSGEARRSMMNDMRALRTDLEQLQTASRDEVRDRKSPHLDRVERMVEMVAEAAAHMRSM